MFCKECTDLTEEDLDDIDEPEALAGELANLENVSLGINVTHMRCGVHTLQLAIQDGLKQAEIKKKCRAKPGMWLKSSEHPRYTKF